MTIKKNQIPTSTKNKIKPLSKIKVHWDDRPENYSKENKIIIRNKLASKYGVERNNINVIYRPVKINDNGDIIEITGSNIDNILDQNYQIGLIKEYLKREGTSVTIEDILEIDKEIQNDLVIPDETSYNKVWAFKWIEINNFLSFGDNNKLELDKLSGLNIVNSLPTNTGGKTTLTIDTIKFILFGTTTKTDKFEEIFNHYRDKNELSVKGHFVSNNIDVIIERKLTRKAKKSGGWSVENIVNYYEQMPDGTTELLNGENSVKTNKEIIKTVGTEKDFERLVLATEKNLDELIGLTSAESTKVFTRLIGFDIVEQKEQIARKKYNEFNNKKYSNTYDQVTLLEEINAHKEEIDVLLNHIQQSTDHRNDLIKNIKELSDTIETQISSKQKVDVDLVNINPDVLQSEIDKMVATGVDLKGKIEVLNKRVDELKSVVFNEQEYYDQSLKLNQLKSDKTYKEAQVKKNESDIKTLIESGVCPHCKQKLVGVDNTEHIENLKNVIILLNNEISDLTKNIEFETKVFEGMQKTKVQYDLKNKTELDRDRLEVEINSLRNKVVEKKNDQKRYKINIDAIELNKSIDIEINNNKTKLSVATYDKEQTTNKITRLNIQVEDNKKNIIKKEELIEKLKIEAIKDLKYRTYVSVFGKNGITKLVLRSLLPIINSEMQRMLSDSCSFDIEIFISDKNDIQFLLIEDDVTKPLKSGSGFEKTAASLALRAVLGRISNLSKPNFITFDEVLGKVANDNIERLKPLFDKIKTMYDTVFLITHNEYVKDWGEHIITVEKVNHVSKINLL